MRRKISSNLPRTCTTTPFTRRMVALTMRHIQGMDGNRQLDCKHPARVQEWSKKTLIMVLTRCTRILLPSVPLPHRGQSFVHLGEDGLQEADTVHNDVKHSSGTGVQQG
jgi:hypothetical protein